MENLGLYGLAFLISTVKFLFAASIVSATVLTPFEIAISTGLGALFSFNIFYWSAGYFMRRAKEKKIAAMKNGTHKSKAAFTKMNKFMVKAKMSKSGFWLICILAPLFLSVPIGSVIVAKFYSDNKLAYPTTMVSLSILAFILAYLNGAIFTFFK
jgi:hypothetical protein